MAEKIIFHRRAARAAQALAPREDAKIKIFLFSVETRLPCLSSRWRAGDGKKHNLFPP